MAQSSAVHEDTQSRASVTRESAQHAVTSVNNTKVHGRKVKVQQSSLFAPLKEGLTFDGVPSQSKFSHLLVVDPPTKLKRSREQDDDGLPDYCDDDNEEDHILLPAAKHPPLAIGTPSKANTLTISLFPHQKNLLPTQVEKNLFPNIQCVTKGEDEKASHHSKLAVASMNPEPVNRLSGTRRTPSTISFSFASPPPLQKKPSGQSSVLGDEVTHKIVDPLPSAYAIQNHKPALPRKPHIITTSVPVSSLFVRRRSKFLKEIGSGCDINLSPNNSEAVVTGEQHQVKVIAKRLEKEFHVFKSDLKTTSVSIEAIYASLFLEESFVKKISEDFVGVEFLVQCSSGKRIPVDEVSRLLKGNRDCILKLNHLYKLDLLTQVVKQQWFIQCTDGKWDEIPQETNNLLTSSCSKQILDIKDGSVLYKLDLQNKTATNSVTGFQHPLKCDDSKAIWYSHQDENFGFVPYSNEESAKIEKCYKTHISEPVICNDGRSCYFSFQSQVEIDVTNKSLRSIKREPAISSTFISPSICFYLTGLQSDIKLTFERFDEFLQSMVTTVNSPLPVSCTELFESHAQQYSVKATSSQGGHVSIRGIEHYVDRVLIELLQVVHKDSFTSEISYPVRRAEV